MMLLTRSPDAAVAVLLPATILLYLSVAPYTKVEESFNIQAIHDFLHFRTSGATLTTDLRNHFDHVNFPGSVPRTFVGAATIAAVSYPFSLLVHGVHQQILVRTILGLFNALCLLVYRNGLFKAYGGTTANWFVLLQASQFHIMYYASRTLPNMLAFGLTTIALVAFLPCYREPEEERRPKTSSTLGSIRASWRKPIYPSISTLALTAVVFRAEVVLLLVSYALLCLLSHRFDIISMIGAGVVGTVAGLLIAVPIDSLMWQRPFVWAELEGFLFNVLNGKSSEWGTSPPTYYFLNALPRLLLNPMSLAIYIPLAVYTRTRDSVMAVAPSLVFIFLYSFQPHKEWRFIVYTIPVLTGIAAQGAAWIWDRRAKSIIYQVLTVSLVASTMMSYLVSLVIAMVSSLNYPGADALQNFHAIALVDLSEAQSIHPAVSGALINVHMDTLSCMTGITRFLEVKPIVLESYGALNVTFSYDKTEDEATLLDPAFWATFDYVLTEKPERVIGAWEIVTTIQGLAAVGLMDIRKDNAEASPTYEAIGGGPWSGLSPILLKWWRACEKLMRGLSGGRWVGMKLEDKIRVLRKTRGAG